MGRLRVRLHVPDCRPNDAGSKVRVAVVDTSQADALHPTVVEAEGVVKAGSKRIDVTLDVPSGALQKRHRYALTAHVDHAGTGAFQAGDLIITESIPVTVEDAERDVVTIDANLTRI